MYFRHISRNTKIEVETFEWYWDISGMKFDPRIILFNTVIICCTHSICIISSTPSFPMGSSLSPNMSIAHHFWSTKWNHHYLSISASIVKCAVLRITTTELQKSIPSPNITTVFDYTPWITYQFSVKKRLLEKGQVTFSSWKYKR